jgi:hypothetical protein
VFGNGTYADISYRIPGFSVDKVTNVSPRINSEPVSSQTYLDLYDVLFSVTEKDDLQKALLDHVASPFHAEQSNMGDRQVELYFMPWLIQFPFPVTPHGDLPERTVNATLCQSIVRVQLAWKSFYTYTVFSLFTLGWCLFRILQTVLNPTPPSSVFPDLDIADKFVGDEHNQSRIREIFSGLSTVTTLDIVARLEEKRIHIRAADPKPQDEVEMGWISWRGVRSRNRRR